MLRYEVKTIEFAFSISFSVYSDLQRYSIQYGTHTK